MRFDVQRHENLPGFMVVVDLNTKAVWFSSVSEGQCKAVCKALNDYEAGNQ